MTLEGTLQAFGLPDVLALLGRTGASGALHVRRAGRHGVVHLCDGAVSGAREDVSRQALARRLVAAGLVDDEALAAAAGEPGALAPLLARGLDDGALARVAAEQVTDAVCGLLRWPDGEFAFQAGEPDRDEVGVRLPVDALLAEGGRRLARPTGATPAPDDVVRLAPAPPEEPVLTRQEWHVLSLVDGRRTVAELVVLGARGEHAVPEVLADLLGRGLLRLGADEGDALRREELLARAEAAPAALVDVDTTLLLRLLGGVKGL